VVGCTEPATAALDTVTLNVDEGGRETLKFLVDTGAQVSLCKYGSIQEGSVYDSKRVINVRGISSGTERALSEIEMSLRTWNYEMKHVFHVVADGIRILYDGILEQDFFTSKKAQTDFQRRELLWVM
jgi:hypothetical protein